MKRINSLRVIISSFLILCFLAVTQAQEVKSERLAGTYEGKSKKGIADGLGKATGKDTYEGTFKKGLPDGKGVYIFGEDVTLNDYKYSKGDRYEGEFKNGLFNGEGKLVFADSEKGVLSGYFSKGEYIGKTKNGYEWVKEDSENVFKVVATRGGDVKNGVVVTGIVDVFETGKKHPMYFPDDQEWKDLLPEEFPFTVYITGRSEETDNRVKVKVILERPGSWTIKVYPK